MTPTDRLPEERIALLLRALPVAPEAWVEAAIRLPALRRDLDEVLTHAARDARFRAAIEQDLARALREAGYELDDRMVERLRARLPHHAE